MSTADATLATSPPADERRSSRWMQRASDWFNPILVKEVRQSLKSRQFVLTFLLLLVGAWMVSFLSVMWLGDELEFGNAGARVFWWYYLVLSVAMFVIVPFTAFRSLLAERDDNTLDLLSITTLAPRQIVRGKLLSATVQLFIFYSAVAPFVAFSSMLKGFAGTAVLYVLVLSLLVSVLVCMFSLMVGTLAKTRTWQALLAFALLAGLIFLFSMFSLVEFGGGMFGFAGAIVGEEPPFDEPWFWWSNAVILLIALSYAALFERIAIARLTFESDNCSTGIRVICVLQFLLACACLGSVWILPAIGDVIDGWYVVGWLAPHLQALRPPISFGRFFEEMAPPAIVLSMLHFGSVGLFASTERSELSRRLRRGLPRNRFLRFLAAPWLPGGGRGYVYTLGCLALLWLVVLACLSVDGTATPFELALGALAHGSVAGGETVQLATVGCCYVAIYAGVGCLLMQLLLPMSGELKPGHVRVVTVLVALGGIIVPYLIQSFGVRALQSYSPLLVSVPFDTMDHVAHGREYADLVSWILMIVAIVVFLANLPAIVRSFRELDETDPERLRRIDAARHEEEG